MSEKQFAQLEAEPAKGPAAYGRDDQRWALRGGLAGARGTWVVFEGEAGSPMRPGSGFVQQ
ncbi:hypothetical protein ACFPC0_07630 [Streptomyces andamanensis]|uniref:Uncharacterized protein n=1 Tax=Streptomyces andamanensis TaxID=1565035 RepID=A0ABV8TAV3_9ACTN